MSAEPDPKPAAADRPGPAPPGADRFPVWFFALIPAAIALVVYLHLTISRPALATANAFVAAVQAGNTRAAEPLATRALARALFAPPEAAGRPDGDGARTLARLRRHPRIELSGGQLSAGFDWACVSADLDDGQPVWIVVRKEGRAWRVDDVRGEARPRICEHD